jgi:hypothetical protein
MSDPNSPLNVLAALNRIEEGLPELVGQDWQVIGNDVQTKMQQLRQSHDSHEQDTLRDDLLIALAPYAVARTRLGTELALQAMIRQALEAQCKAFATELGIDVDAVYDLLAAAHCALFWTLEDGVTLTLEDVGRSRFLGRTIQLVPAGQGGATSVKLSNLKLSKKTLLAVAGAVGAAMQMATGPTLFAVMASVLSTAGALAGIDLEEHLSQNEASVFWGLIQARDLYNCATETALFEKTNAEREKYGLGPLTRDRFTAALKRLEALKCVELFRSIPRTWHMTETFEIRD